jgi:hypothetical protein
MKTILFALLITLLTAYYQRATGPTYPKRGEVTINGVAYDYKLLRSHGGETDAQIAVTIPDTSVHPVLKWRRFKAGDDWTAIPMQRNGDQLEAMLPNQPPAGKLEYFIELHQGAKILTMPEKESVVIRFKGDVPGTVLVPHILFMFIAMLMSNAAAIEAVRKGGHHYRYALIATGFLLIGGMILGPVVQKFAFGEYWTGFPWGYDLTDNKTLIAMIAWALAVWRGKNVRGWIIGAAVVLLLVYSIPHSMFGSELNYETMQVETSEH